MDTLLQDIKFGARQLRRTPGFAIVVVLTLALGIGANTAIFSVMNAVMLRFLPVRDPQQLVMLKYSDQPRNTSQTGHDNASLSYPVYDEVRKRTDVFSDVMAFVPLSFAKTVVRYGSEPEEAQGEEVSGNFFSGLGVPLVRGRGFTPEDDDKHSNVVVLSYSYWRRRFGRSPEVLGQTLYVKGIPFTIVGVASPEFAGLDREVVTDFWVPLQDDPRLKPWGASPTAEEGLKSDPKWWYLMCIARLAPGVTAQQAEQQILPTFQHAAYIAGPPEKDEKMPRLLVTPARGIEGLNREYKEPLTALMIMVGLVLVIACGNVAMLLIARNLGRQREFSLRLALGGSRLRLFRQLLTESLLLVAAGAVLGWLFAISATRALAAWSILEVSLAPDRLVLVFTAGVSMLAAVVFGLAPLRSASRTPMGMALKTSAANAGQDRHKLRSGQVVVALQISLCLMLLVSAVLVERTLKNLENANLGMRVNGLLVFGITPPQGLKTHTEVVNFHNTLLQRLRTLPSVESATVMSERLGSGWSNNTGVKVDGVNPLGTKFAPVRWNAVGPDFFHVLGIPILQGRDFNDSDNESAPPVALVNQTFVKRYLPKGEPLGHTITFNSKTPSTIVGVVADSKFTSVREGPRPMAWAPYAQQPWIATMQYELRTHGDPNLLLPQIRRMVQDYGPDIPLLEPKTQLEQFHQSFSEDLLFARLSVFFGALAALLVATGLYGTLAYRVNRRTSEIGVRMALGAQRTQVLWMVVREGLILMAFGVGVGLPLAFVGVRLLKSLLFGLSPWDPLTFVVALFGLAAVTLVASLIPARRASSVDPMVALRYE